MKSNTSANIAGQVTSSMLFILGVIFIILKLAGVINWSWWLVCAPLLIQPAIMLTILIVGVVTFLVFAIVGYIVDTIKYLTEG